MNWICYKGNGTVYHIGFQFFNNFFLQWFIFQFIMDWMYINKSTVWYSGKYFAHVFSVCQMEKFSNKFPLNFSANDEQSTMHWYKLLNLKCLDFIFDHAHFKWNKSVTKRILKNPPKPNRNKWNCWLNMAFNVDRTNAK